MATWELLVVGGGIVGAAAAYHAARAGAQVLVVDREDAGRATSAGAGIISPETDIHRAGAYLELGRRAADHYPELLRDLPSRAGYDRCGMLVVAADEEEAHAFDAFAGATLQRQREADDLPEPERLRLVGADEALQRFPALARVERVLWNPRGARVDGREITAALHEAATARGAQRTAGSVGSIRIDRRTARDADAHVRGAHGSEPGTGVAAVVDGEEHLAAAVIIAGGAWSPSLAASLDVRVPVEPQRGQIAHLLLEHADTARWPMVSGFRDHYLVAWPGGRVAAGATRETGSGFDVRATAAGVREVLSEALRLAPGLASATLHEVRVGLRPLARDGMPILGPVPGCPGVWLATGHGPAGLTLGPYSAKLVVEAALGGSWPAELGAFSIARFASTDPGAAG